MPPQIPHNLPSMPTTDADAAETADIADMAGLCAGEDLALNRLMDRHRENVFRFLTRMLQDESEAMDLAQESFVRVYLNRAKFNPRHRFSTWLYTIASNLARDRIRWLGRHKTVSMDAPIATGQEGSETSLGEALPEGKMGPSERLEQLERVEQIKRGLAEIPEELRTPLVLVEYEDLSQAEIATILNCSPKAVENRLYRARKLLREKLGHLLG